MNRIPDFLPAILKLDGTWEQVLELIYDVFVKDFKERQTKHCGLKVVYDNRILPNGRGKEEGFWHVISKLDYHTKERLIDFRKSERLPWARPMMESEERVELKVFDYDHGPKDKGIRRYIWLEDFDYVLVLQPRRKIYVWITAYYVDYEGRRKKLAKRYVNRV